MSAPRFQHKGLKTAPVVLDFGECYIKCGFAGEGNPRHIFSSDLDKNRPNSKPISLRSWLTIISKLMNTMYFHRLLTNPKDRPVVVCENFYWSYAFKEALVKVLFQLGVPSILFVPMIAVCVYTSGLDSALVIDIGYKETRVLPICDGFPLFGSISSIPVGMSSIQHRVRELLASSMKSETPIPFELDSKQETVIDPLLHNKILDRLIMQSCYVQSLSESGHEIKGEKKISLDKKITSFTYCVGCTSQGQKRTVTFTGDIRSGGCESIFGVNSEGLSIAEAVCQSLSKCLPDNRSIVAQQLILTGGAASIPGLGSRLLEEIYQLIKRPEYTTLQGLKDKLRIAPNVFSPAILNWVGASIAGGVGSELEEYHYSKEQFERGVPIPDWTIPSSYPSLFISQPLRKGGKILQ